MSYTEAVRSVSYQERVQLALSHVGENPRSFSKGDWFLEDGFRVECIEVLEADGEVVSLFVCIDTITKGICFYYFDSSPDPKLERWGNTFFLLHCCVTRGIEPIYQSWLDSHGYSLAPKPMELEEEPWLIERIIGWKHEE